MRTKKIIGWRHKEPAKNDDYACNKCGGDIRGMCCTAETCEPIYEEKHNEIKGGGKDVV